MLSGAINHGSGVALGARRCDTFQAVFVLSWAHGYFHIVVLRGYLRCAFFDRPRFGSCAESIIFWNDSGRTCRCQFADSPQYSSWIVGLSRDLFAPDRCFGPVQNHTQNRCVFPQHLFNLADFGSRGHAATRNNQNAINVW